MARLIIGHVTDTTAKIWVRGKCFFHWAHISLSQNGKHIKTEKLELQERHGYTGCMEFKGLKARTDYTCEVAFGPSKDTKSFLLIDFGNCRGKFTTAPNSADKTPFSFLLGSCNLHSLGFVNSPDKAYEILIDKAEDSNASFMIHCGDQIYYDIPNPVKQPELEEYRQKYLDAWSDCRPARAFLTRLPHYMIFDDHEITNNFSNDFNPPGDCHDAADFKREAMKAYREFVHIRHPKSDMQAYYYQFSHGPAEFFVMDTRTERWSYQANKFDNQIVSEEQLSQLKTWLKQHNNRPKFIVTSVPFVGQVKHNNDKWSAEVFRHQRESLIEFFIDEKIQKVCFLTGDMHSSYHGTLEIKSDSHQVTIHELMSSPINQIEKNSYDKLRTPYNAKTPKGYSYKSKVLKAEFYNKHSNAMKITLSKDTVAWEIFRTKKKRVDKRKSFSF